MSSVRGFDFSGSIISLLIICLLFISKCIVADQKFYQNSITTREPTAYVNLEIPFVAHNTISINSNQFSGTNETIYVTFIGDFSSSGPHPITDLTDPSSVVTYSILLDRTIGQLHSVWIENKGFDSLLLSAWQIRIRENIYELAIENKWLESYDPVLAAQDGDGFSPRADIKLESSPTLLLPVKSSQFYYTNVGLFTGN